MSMRPEITERDLRSRSKEIIDAVQSGQSFAVRRDGHQIGELVPLRRQRRFVARAESAAMSQASPHVSLEEFRADQEATVDDEVSDPQ